MPKRYYKAAWKSFLEPIFNNGATVTHRKLAELENEVEEVQHDINYLIIDISGD